MEEKKKITKKEILQFLPFLCMVIAVIALLSYAYITVDLEGSKISGITKPEVSMSYEEKSNALNLALTPMSDATGKAQTNYFEFKIDATGKIDGEIPATIYINETTKTIGNENIKMYLTKVENNTETQVLAPTAVSALKKYSAEENSYILNTKTYTFTNTENKSYSDTYRLRVWLKEGATIESGDYTTKTETDGSITAETASANYQFKVNVTTQAIPKTGAETLMEKVGTGGLVAETHPATEQLIATTAYRYTGKSPNNYIKFNNETWRIIGVFDVDDGTGKLEKRIKIVKISTRESFVWSDTNSSWSKGSGMTYLNTDYYNKIKDEAKNLISDAKWYLGAAVNYDNATNGLASNFYEYERGTDVPMGYDNVPADSAWVGKVGLIYPSDYGYATSGGTTKNREACLAKELSNWGDSSYSNCYQNDWLYVSNIRDQWTITPNGNSFTGNVFIISRTNGAISYTSESSTIEGSPTVYLKVDVTLTGEGTSSSPYEIK